MNEQITIRPFHWWLGGLSCLTVISLGVTVGASFHIISLAKFLCLIGVILAIAVGLAFLNWVQSQSFWLTAVTGGVLLLIFILTTIFVAIS